MFSNSKSGMGAGAGGGPNHKFSSNKQPFTYSSSSSNWQPKKEVQDDRWKSYVTDSAKTNDSKLLASFSGGYTTESNNKSSKKPYNAFSSTMSPVSATSSTMSVPKSTSAVSTPVSSPSPQSNETSTFPSGTYAGLLASKLAKKPLGSALRNTNGKLKSIF